jgi:hypothetical protein
VETEDANHFAHPLNTRTACRIFQALTTPDGRYFAFSKIIYRFALRGKNRLKAFQSVKIAPGVAPGLHNTFIL